MSICPPTQRTGPARAAVQDAADTRETISLSEVMAQAALQTRVDRKFLLTPEQFCAFNQELGDVFRIMQIDQRTLFRYASTYFDTPDFEQYRAHRQGRRCRYKVRSRTYVDTGLSMFEVKTKGLRGKTVKHRMQQPPQEADQLSHKAQDFLAQVLRREYDLPAPSLHPVLDSSYVRATFVDPVDGERVTADVQLGYQDYRQNLSGPELVVVETKTRDGRGHCDLALARLGIRPVSMSKYCIGVALLNPELPANRWSRLLQRHFYPALSR